MPLSQQYGFWPGEYFYKIFDQSGVSMPLSQQYGFWHKVNPNYLTFNDSLNAALAAIWFLASKKISI